MSKMAMHGDAGSDLYSIAIRQFDSASRLMGLDENLHRVLRTPKRVFTVQVPIERETGEIEVFIGYRVQHNINRGPAIGGLRLNPESGVEEVIALVRGELLKSHVSVQMKLAQGLKRIGSSRKATLPTESRCLDMKRILWVGISLAATAAALAGDLNQFLQRAPARTVA